MLSLNSYYSLHQFRSWGGPREDNDSIIILGEVSSLVRCLCPVSPPGKEGNCSQVVSLM